MVFPSDFKDPTSILFTCVLFEFNQPQIPAVTCWIFNLLRYASTCPFLLQTYILAAMPVAHISSNYAAKEYQQV